MAVLSKIRDRSLFLILIIGMALFAFVASPKDIVSFFKSDKTNAVGSINGENISRDEFVTQIKAYQTGRSNLNDTQAANAVWNNLLSEKIYASQLENAGIVVGEKDIWEALIHDSSISNNPQFLNEAGLFDEESLKSYIADLQEDDTVDGKNRWMNWLSYERQLKQNLERDAYLNLVKAGLGISNAEGKRNYFLNNTKVTGNYVLLPFAKIPDSTISVSDSDIQKYINNHKNDFQVEASRSIQYVKFDLSASEEDKISIKEELTSLIEDNSETEEGVGLKNTTDPAIFVSETSDTPYNDNFVFKNTLNAATADSLFSLKVGDIYGPYEEAGYFKISKIIANNEVPSVKASHILIAYEGALRANPEVKRTKEEAQAKAQEILRKVKKSSVDFAAEAKVSSDGPSGPRGGDLGWFKEGQMVPAFNDWVFANKKDKVGLVETDFGFHVIKVDDTKAEQGLKLATVSKLITPSEETENKVFVEAETFAAAISKGQDLKELASEKKYSVKNGQKLGKRDESVPGLTGNNRSIIYWAFDESTELAAIKRFDIDKAYVVAQVTRKEAEGLQTAKSAIARVRPLVIRDKKAAILSKKLESGTLEEIAKAEDERVKSTEETAFGNPVTSALGRDKAIVGALLGMNENDISRGVQGTTGMYIIELIKKTAPVELESYEPYRVRLENSLKKDNTTIFNALKKASNVEDYRD